MRNPRAAIIGAAAVVVVVMSAAVWHLSFDDERSRGAPVYAYGGSGRSLRYRGASEATTAAVSLRRDSSASPPNARQQAAGLRIVPAGHAPPPVASHTHESHDVGGTSIFRVLQRRSGASCALSAHARSVQLAGKFAQICRFCRLPRADTVASWGVPPIATPSFCREEHRKEVSSQGARHDFSAPIAGVLPVVGDALGQSGPLPRLDVVFCALGARFHGRGGQDYVLESIRQWRVFHPTSAESSIYLIVSRAAVEELAAFAAQFLVTLVLDEDIMTDAWKTYRRVFYIQGYMHPGGSRQTGNKDFNKFVSERFFAVHGLMTHHGRRALRSFVIRAADDDGGEEAPSQRPTTAAPSSIRAEVGRAPGADTANELVNIFHLENDIMVYGDMREWVAPLQRCGHRLASTVPSTKGVIPGILYVRDASDLGRLVDFIVELLSCNATFGKKLQEGYANDMTYLMNFYQYYGSEWMGMLPSWIPGSDGEVCVTQDHQAWRRAQQRAEASAENIENGGIHLFDAASFGQWYSFAAVATGVADLKGRPPLHVANSMKGRFLDATPPPSLEWRRDPQGRRILVWNGLHRLVSLHVHAKNLKLFRSLEYDESAKPVKDSST